MSAERLPARHRRVIRALESGPRAPERLYRRIEELEAQRRGGPRAWAPGVAVGRPAWLGRGLLAAGVAAAFAVALVVVLGSLGGPSAPTVVAAAELSLRPATGPPPHASAERPELLERSFAGVSFPAWSERFGWDASGVRGDELDGRRTQTVFYRHTHHRIGYTVISGATISPPADAEVLNQAGVKLYRFRLGRQDVVTFERGGQTCVLSGAVHDPDTLVKLASWKGEGAVGF
jgi:hypothetical protein